MYNSIIIAIDPGRNKCGLAVVDRQGQALELELVPRDNLSVRLQATFAEWRFKSSELVVLMGNGTQHQQVLQEIEQSCKITIQLVEEYGSTLAARELYWQRNQASCWQRLLPATWRSTPPLDAYAAWAIAKRYIANSVCA